jgi:hypothetical protein
VENRGFSEVSQRRFKSSKNVFIKLVSPIAGIAFSAFGIRLRCQSGLRMPRRRVGFGPANGKSTRLISVQLRPIPF